MSSDWDFLEKIKHEIEEKIMTKEMVFEKEILLEAMSRMCDQYEAILGI